jgi:hypothetical protein
VKAEKGERRTKPEEERTRPQKLRNSEDTIQKDEKISGQIEMSFRREKFLDCGGPEDEKTEKTIVYDNDHRGPEKARKDPGLGGPETTETGD